MIEQFIKNPVKVSVGVILVLMFGTIALRLMPVQLTPEVQIPTLTIETTWPGASAQEVEREIVLEQEEQLQSVEGVRKLTSESMDSMAKITLEFPIGTNLGETLTLVNSRLQQVREYPENADEPVIATSNSSDRPIAWFILTQLPPSREMVLAQGEKHPELKSKLEHAVSSDNSGLTLYRIKALVAQHPELAEIAPALIDVTKERRFAEDFIEARFERVDGVSQANVLGGREEEMQVLVDPEALAARQLTIDDVRRALIGQNKDTSAGDFWEGKRRYVVRTLGQFRSPEQVASTILDSRDGRTVYLRDVAEVKLGYKKPDGMVRRFGNDVVAINAMRETGANVLTVMNGLREAVVELNERVLAPRGMFLSQVYDETEYIHSSMKLVEENLVEGSILTFIVLLLFLRNIQSTVVVFISITVSFVGMFLILGVLGRSLNVPSLAGIAFAVGMLVDNFIVVLENIYRHRQNGDDVYTATVNGASEVWGAIVAATLANLAVFIPVLFVQDEAGQLFRDIALATSSAVAISLLVALIVVPTAAYRLLPPDRAPDTATGAGKRSWLRPFALVWNWLGRACNFILWPLDQFGSLFTTAVVELNTWLQASVLRRLLTVVLLVGGAAYLSFLLLPKVEYLPNGNRNLVFGIMLPPPGYNLGQLSEMGELVERELKPYWDVDPNSPEAKELKFPIIGDLFYVARGRQLFLGVRALDPERAKELEGLVMMIGAKLPGTILIAKQSSLFEQGLTGGRTIEVEIVGTEIERLVGLGVQVLVQSKGLIPDAQIRPIPSLDLSSPEMHIVPKWNQASEMGVSAVDLGYAVDALVDGAYATDYYLGSDKIDLSIVGLESYASRTQDLAQLAIATPQGSLVPLEAVANVEYRNGPEQINRRERQRAITIEVTPPATVPLEQAMETIRDQVLRPMSEKGLFSGMEQPRLSGTADKLATTWASLRWNLLLALVITYLLMAALFESWLYPTVIILSVPLGAVGGFAGLAVLNNYVLPPGVVQPLDVLTMLGFIILVGTVVNNPILIVEQALNLIREEGMNYRQAVTESVRTRIRPIFMTALIGFFGLVPLVIAPGAGSELYRGMGSVLLGGLVVSTIFTLFQVPSLFSLTLEASEFVTRALAGKAPNTPGSPADSASGNEVAPTLPRVPTASPPAAVGATLSAAAAAPTVTVPSLSTSTATMPVPALRGGTENGAAPIGPAKVSQ